MGDRVRSRSPRGNGSSSSNEDIMRLVVQREQARLQKDWSQADAFRDELGALGVSLLDKSSTWKAADGRTGRIPTFSEVENGAGSPDAVMAMMEEKAHPQPPVYSSDSEEGKIKNLIREREEARSAKDYARSDQIRDDLKAMGVEIHDKDKIWNSKNGYSGVIIGYNAGGGSGPCPTDTEINTLVQQREKARSEKEWSMADMIRDELKQWGVEIFDKDKVWRANDGRSGPVPQWSQVGAVAQVPAAYAVPPSVAPMQADLNRLIAACVANAQNPATSARTIALLQQAANVGPSYGGGQYGYPPPQYQSTPSGRKSVPSRRDAGHGGGGGEFQDALNFCKDHKVAARGAEDDEITWLIEVRERCRRDKDYGGADKLRDAFRTLGLELHEKEKSWTMSDGRRGEIPSWQSL